MIEISTVRFPVAQAKPRIVAVDGEPMTAAGGQLLLLAGWVVVSFVVASRLFRFRDA